MNISFSPALVKSVLTLSHKNYLSSSAKRDLERSLIHPDIEDGDY